MALGNRLFALGENCGLAHGRPDSPHTIPQPRKLLHVVRVELGEVRLGHSKHGVRRQRIHAGDSRDARYKDTMPSATLGSPEYSSSPVAEIEYPGIAF